MAAPAFVAVPALNRMSSLIERIRSLNEIADGAIPLRPTSRSLIFRALAAAGQTLEQCNTFGTSHGPGMCTALLLVVGFASALFQGFARMNISVSALILPGMFNLQIWTEGEGWGLAALRCRVLAWCREFIEQLELVASLCPFVRRRSIFNPVSLLASSSASLPRGACKTDAAPGGR